MSLRLAWLSILLFVCGGASASVCERYFNSGLNISASYMSYLDELLGQRLLTLDELRMVVANPLGNPLRGARELSRMIHAHELDLYLLGGEISSEEVSEWAREKSLTLTQIQTARAVVAAQTHVRDFQMLRVGGRQKIRSFELMSTLITQGTWLRVMGENPAAHQGDLDFPIENITWMSAAEFANRLSRAEGLFPVYEFVGTPQAGTRAEDGTLTGYEDVIVHARYSGYRLPSRAEMSFVTSDGGRYIGSNFGLSTEEASDYVWHAENSGGVSQPVGALKPFLVAGQAFYDLIGNLTVWCGKTEIYRGVSYASSFGAGGGTPFAGSARLRRSTVGLRLARSL